MVPALVHEKKKTKAWMPLQITQLCIKLYTIYKHPTLICIIKSIKHVD